MKYRLLHLNILKGRFLGRLIPYLRREQYDFLNLQEVAGGSASLSRSRDNFADLRRALRLQGFLAKTQQAKNQPTYYDGSATLWGSRARILQTQVVWLKKNRLKPLWKMRDQDKSRCAVVSLGESGGKRFYLINCHLAWGPTPKDKKFKLIQGQKLVDFVKKLRKPFILTGDFNLTANSQIVKAFDRLARNLAVEAKITNTLNGRTHRIKRLFPRGLAVDFVFVARGIRVKKFSLVDKPDLSDHYGLALEFEI